MPEPSRPLVPCLLLLLAAGCGGAEPTAVPEGGAAPAPVHGRIPGPAREVGRVPLTELGTGSYLGFGGGLYPGGGNDLPADHADAGRAQARAIRPLDRLGNPSAGGSYVLLAIGMSNPAQEFCSEEGACTRGSFMGQAAVDGEVDHGRLAIVNGALGGAGARSWTESTSASYERVRTERLAPLGLSESQVQIVWLKVANAFPQASLPDWNADARQLERELGDILRALRRRYPNLRQVFVSSRVYGGFAGNLNNTNPEPFAYESGFAVKWLVEAQIQQARSGRIDAEAGPLGPDQAPWVAWGPYLWADGASRRADGLAWQPWDFEEDGTHPSPQGERKVGFLLLDFFKGSPVTGCWFLAGRTCS